MIANYQKVLLNIAGGSRGTLKMLYRKKLIVFLLCLFCFSVIIPTYGQQITLSVKKEKLIHVIKELRKQSRGYDFAFGAEVLDKSYPVTLTLTKSSIEKALEEIFKGQPLTYEIRGNTIIIKEKGIQEKKKENGKIERLTDQQFLYGHVVDEKGDPVAGASVRVKGTDKVVITDNNGNFKLPETYTDNTIQIVYIGYAPIELIALDNVTAVLKKSESVLDEAVVIGYGTTTKRLNTGSVSKITSKDIERQPVSNPLATLAGKVPGLIVTQGSGVSGSSFSLQIRGRNSVTQGSEPLILIDGIPFAPQNQGINVLSSAITQGGNASLSPFGTLNPADIESIDVLKDADATAIYGSRGANGVILITTKKGKTGKSQITANISQGVMKAQRGMKLMNTQEYIAMRKEAFQNNGTIPTQADAPDLTIWDQNRYTDLRKELVENTAHMNNASLSISGGNNDVQFLISGGYNTENNVFPGKQPNNRGNGNFSLTHTSPNNKFNVTLSSGYSVTRNTSNSGDLSLYSFLPPNIPGFFNEDGSLKWSEGEIEYENPYAYLKQLYEAKSNTFTSSMNLSYVLMDGLSLKLLTGYNHLQSKDYMGLPKSSFAPSNTFESQASHGTNNFSSWNIEPQINYKSKVGLGKLDVLVGTTFHQKQNETTSLSLSGFASEALLRSIQAASAVTAKSDNFTDYRYTAVFGRINYNISDKYLVNLTGRRDGSSRFGPNNQFANFGAIGGAYILSAEDWMQRLKPLLSFVKIRGSYGVTGNDQIGDYKYLDSWATYYTTYQGNPTLQQTALFNADYNWEKNRKLEGAIELGFWKDRFMLSANFFRNSSNNQLVNYRLPYTTGFSTITRNIPALIENKGWEIQLSASLLQLEKLTWNLNANITIPKNKLLDFPDLETSTYASNYQIGYPLNVIRGFTSSGIDPSTGFYVYNDLNGSGTLTSADYDVLGTTDPRYYGGLGTDLTYNGWQFNLFADFRKQTGRNFLYSIYSQGFVAGTMRNQPTQLLDRWISEPEPGIYEKYVPNVTNGTNRFKTSQLAYSDQSFIRLRTVSLSYDLDPHWLSRIKAKQVKIYFQGQNLFTSSKTKGYNPETQQLYGLAPLRVYNFGVQVTY